VHWYNLDATKKTLLVLGGSLGARRVNQLIEKNWKHSKPKCSGIMWKLYFEEYKSIILLLFKSSLLSKEWILYMHLLILLSRAGASSVSELSIVGKPVILFPSLMWLKTIKQKTLKLLLIKALLLKESELESQFSVF
jgi:UDP-N-acetylglucosamine--N-acetylmuramyl-(pentapeptide) pyrophosphoryl-undecaprenol N-acetylglucosamine transferase